MAHEGKNPRVRTYHDITIDVFNNKVTNIIYSSISVQNPDSTSFVRRWICWEGGA
jgi:hypothetical protein